MVSITLSKHQEIRILQFLTIPLLLYLLFYPWIEPLDKMIAIPGMSRQEWRLSMVLLMLGIVLGLWYVLIRPGENLAGLEAAITKQGWVFLLVIGILTFHTLAHFPPLDFYQQDALNPSWFDEMMHFLAGVVVAVVVLHLPQAKHKNMVPLLIYIMISVLILNEFYELMVWGYKSSWNVDNTLPEVMSMVDIVSDIVFGMLGISLTLIFWWRYKKRGASLNTKTNVNKLTGQWDSNHMIGSFRTNKPKDFGKNVSVNSINEYDR